MVHIIDFVIFTIVWFVGKYVAGKLVFWVRSRHELRKIEKANSKEKPLLQRLAERSCRLYNVSQNLYMKCEHGCLLSDECAGFIKLVKEESRKNIRLLREAKRKLKGVRLCKD